MRDGVTSSTAPVVDLWLFGLDVDREAVGRYVCLLSAEECARAKRYRSDADRRRFIVRRGRLRETLARELGCDGRAIAITENHFGKPLAQGTDLRFSVSHSRGIAVIALTRHADIGCDIEWRDAALEQPSAARLFLSPHEYEALFALTGEERTKAFFGFWTRKEAYLKARGTGLTLPADTVIVTGGGRASLIALPDEDPAAWSLVDLDLLPAGYSGAVAFRGPMPRLRQNFDAAISSGATLQAAAAK